MEIQTKIETITPEIAKNLLAKNPTNRKLNQTRALQIAVDIDEGRWVINGETIILDDEGNLLDGQHRLQAIILADKPIQANVARGINAAYKGTIDIGRSRTLADVLTLDGEKNHAAFKGSVTKAIIAEICGSFAVLKNLTIPKQQKIFQILDGEYPDALLFGATRKRMGAIPYAYVSAFYTLLSITNNFSAQQFELFFDQVTFPENAPIHSPEWALRHWFLKEAELNRGGGANVTARRRNALWAAWSSSVGGQKVESIKIEYEYTIKPIQLVIYETAIIQKIKQIVIEG